MAKYSQMFTLRGGGELDRGSIRSWRIAIITMRRRFEEFLRIRGVPYVAVDEARRSLLSDGRSIKSLDFIVASPGGVSWL